MKPSTLIQEFTLSGAMSVMYCQSQPNHRMKAACLVVQQWGDVAAIKTADRIMRTIEATENEVTG